MQVRVAIAIDSAGNWYAVGSGSLTDDKAMTEALYELDTNESLVSQHWIDADVPTPKSEVIDGEVVSCP